MNKYVSPIIEIEKVEVQDILMNSPEIEQGEDELPSIPLPTGPKNNKVPESLSIYFNK